MNLKKEKEEGLITEMTSKAYNRAEIKKLQEGIDAATDKLDDLIDVGYCDPRTTKILTQAVLGGVLIGFVKIRKSSYDATTSSSFSFS